jgi:hypothetical protein
VAETESRDSVANLRRRCQTSSAEFLAVALLVSRNVKKDEKDADNKGGKHE